MANYLKSCRLAVLALVALFLADPDAHAQLTVQPSNNATALVNTLIGSGVQVFNVTMNCPQDGAGTFNGASTNLNINSGVLLTSGIVQIAAQANIGGAEGVDNLGAGDNDLTALSGDPTFDACALEFDFIATCDTISIAYVFGSEEYDEYVCAGVNDVFGFFINGPGLNNVNIATVPGSTTPVSINTVNIGTAGAFGGFGTNCVYTNTGYYIQNVANTTHEYDGQTVRLEAKTWVTPCSTYHVKLVVADGGDGVFDSGVFLEQSGIRCASQQITVNTTTASGSNYLVEGCTDAMLNFERSGNLSTGFTIHYVVGGTAQNGADYTQITDSVVFAPGTDSVGLLLSAPDDGLVEGLETILIIVADTNCAGAYADTAELFIIDPPLANFTYTRACPFFPVQFTNQSSYAGVITQYSWDFGDGNTGTGPSPQHAYVAAGQYTVQLVIQSSEGCMDSITRTIDISAAPAAAWTAQQFCHQLPTAFQDNSSPGGLSQWAWDFGDGANANTSAPAHSYANPGNYLVTLTITDTAGCRDTSTQAITIFARPAAEFSWVDVCEGAAMDWIDQSTVALGSITTWNWSSSGGASYSTPQVSHVFADTGIYQVTLIVGSDQGCLDTVSHGVEVYPNPVVDFSLDFACIGDTTHFTDLSAIGSGTLQAWDWLFGDGDSSSQQHPIHVYTSAGNYAVTLTVMSDRGCATTLTRDIGRPPVPPSPNVVHDTVCAGFNGQVLAFSPIAGGQVRWYYTPVGAEPFQIGNSHASPPLTFTTPYFVDVLSPDGCVSERIPVFVIVSPSPNVLAEASTYEAEIPTAIIEFQTEDPGNQAATWAWDFGDGNFSTMSDPVHQYIAEGIYYSVLTVTSAFGCVSVYHLPEIVVSQDIRMYIPNAFTPNGDGLNDLFHIQTRLITELDIAIYDRWGKLHFSSSDLNFEWGGKDAQGGELPEGVYTYVVRALGYDGIPVTRSGTVMILR